MSPHDDRDGKQMKRREIITVLIVLTLIFEVLLVPREFSRVLAISDAPVGAITVNVGNTVITSPPFNTSLILSSLVPGSTFWVYVDVINVTDLESYGVGFTFNQTFLQVLTVEDGGFLTSAGGQDYYMNTSVIDNTSGVVITSAGALTNATFAPTGSGHILKVEFRVNPSLSFDGGPVTLMHFNTSFASLTQLSLENGSDADITPLPQNIYDGTFGIDVSNRPIIALKDPIDNAVFSISTITFNVSAIDASGISRVELYLNSALMGNMTSTGNGIYTEALSNVSKGQHSWYAMAYNKIGLNSSTSPKTFTIGTTPAPNYTWAYYIIAAVVILVAISLVFMNTRKRKRQPNTEKPERKKPTAKT